MFCQLLPSLSPVKLCKGRLQNIYNILGRIFPLAVFSNKNPIKKSSCFRHFFSFFQKKEEVIYQQSGKRVADESFPNIRERQTRCQEDSNVSLRMVQRVQTNWSHCTQFYCVIWPIPYCKSLPFFYFLTFEKGRSLYIHPVGRSVGWLVSWSVGRLTSPLIFSMNRGIKALF